MIFRVIKRGGGEPPLVLDFGAFIVIMSGGGGDVESALSDFATRLRWVRGWQSVFFSLYCAVMAVSLVLYLCLIRAVARYVCLQECMGAASS